MSRLKAQKIVNHLRAMLADFEEKNKVRVYNNFNTSHSITIYKVLGEDKDLRIEITFKPDGALITGISDYDESCFGLLLNTIDLIGELNDIKELKKGEK